MKLRLLVPALPLLLLGCSIHGLASNARIAKSSLDYNLQIEETQNKNLLLNIWRAKKRYPLYLTDTSKITGSLTNTYTLGLSIPLATPMGYQFTANPSATLTQNPTFDVNVLNTQDFMRGFLTPLSPATFAYYWRQGWPRELLIHLLVRDITIVDTQSVPHYFSNKKTLLSNYPNPTEKDQVDLAEFSEWAHYLAHFNLSTCQKLVLGGLSSKEFAAVESVTKSLAAGLSFSATEGAESPSASANKKTNKNKETFTGSATSPSTRVIEQSLETSEEGASGTAYNFAIPFDILVDSDSKDAAIARITAACMKLPNQEEALSDGNNGKDGVKPHESSGEDKSQPSGEKQRRQDEDKIVTKLRSGHKVLSPEGVARPEEKEASMLALFSIVEERKGIPTPTSPRTMVVKLALRSPESILYYLGELARLEEYQGFTQRACVSKFMQPIFVAYSEESHVPDCSSPLKIEDGDHEEVFIPPACDPNNSKDRNCRPEMIQECSYHAEPPTEQEAEEQVTFAAILKRPLTALQCNGGRSMHSLNLLSQLIALQKSAKDFPTTPTVKIIGQ